MTRPRYKSVQSCNDPDCQWNDFCNTLWPWNDFDGQWSSIVMTLQNFETIKHQIDIFFIQWNSEIKQTGMFINKLKILYICFIFWFVEVYLHRKEN